MRVLFVPAHLAGAIPHGIPLLALSQLLDTRFTCAFLVPRRCHSFFRSRGAEVLDIAHEDLTTQMLAYKRFRPDIVVDDLSITTALADQLTRIPRVTLQRTGLFAESLSPHTGDESFRSIPDLEPFGLVNPTTLLDVVRANAIIIPSITSIEPLPHDLRAENAKYFYSGPLLTEDVYTEFDQALDEFLEINMGRRIILLTFGTVAKPPSFVQDMMYKLLSLEIPVISTVPLPTVPAGREALFYFGSFLPLRKICARAALVVHHCGSGTYQYPILHKVPSITIGTGYRDRDDVATRLNELGACVHLEYGINYLDFDRRFRQAHQALSDTHSSQLQSTVAVLDRLKLEMEQTAASFRFEHVLEYAREATPVHPQI